MASKPVTRKPLSQDSKPKLTKVTLRDLEVKKQDVKGGRPAQCTGGSGCTYSNAC